MSESVPGPVIATQFLLDAITVDGLAYRGWETKLTQDVRPVLTGKSMKAAGINFEFLNP
jgi:hypothetical protein